MSSNSGDKPALTTEYLSPSSTHSIAISLPHLSPGTQGKRAYLHALRAEVRTMQSQVNEYLTQRMQDDKKVDTKDEENYGEEVVED